MGAKREPNPYSRHSSLPKIFRRPLQKAVASSFGASRFNEQGEWKEALKTSDVRLQWDPDHDPYGNKCERRAVQLGIRGETLSRFSESLISIEDLTPFVLEQYEHIKAQNLEALSMPLETIYPDAFA